ncbi:MAG: SCP2 sterol-binding domain-containing protein [Sedimenticola sp.]
MTIHDLTYAGLEEAINRYLALDPNAIEQLRQFHGRVIAFEMVGLGQTLYFIPGPTRLQLFSQYEGEPDCRLSGTPLALFRMSDQRTSSDQLFDSTVKISGDTELAHHFGKILAAIDIDWEGQLSRYTGGIVAHEVGNLFRSVSHWGKRSLDSLGLNLQGYLQEKLQILPMRPEIDQFLNQVDTLRDDIERMQARIERLKGNRSHKQQGETK